MAEFTRSMSEAAIWKVQSFIKQNIRSKSLQVQHHESNKHNRYLNMSENNGVQLITDTFKGGNDSNNRFSATKKNRINPLSSKRAQQNITQVSKIANAASIKIPLNNNEQENQRTIIDENNNNNNNIKLQKHKPKQKLKIKLALIILVGGTLMGLSQRDLIELARDSFLVVEDDNFFTNIWSDIPVGINICIHVFSLKNGRAFYRGAKPTIERLGPFCYNGFRKRMLTDWTKKTVTFYENYRLEFNPKNSKSLDTEMVSINLPIYISILFTKQLLERFYIKFAGPIVYNILNIALRSTGEKPIEKIPINEFLNGRKINIIVLFDKILDPLRKIGFPIPDYAFGGFKLVNQSYGIAALLNHATLGPIEAYRRSEDGKQVGDIVGINGKRVWPGLRPPCNRLESSDGVFYSRPVTQNELTVFFYITCRLLKFVKQKDHYMYGAYLSRYKIDKDMFTMSDPDNHCFCRKGRSLSSCEGFSDMSNCFFGLPIEMSMPNFLHYENLQKQFTGITSNVEENEGYIDIDPYLGSPVNLRVFIQGNLRLSQIRSVPVLANIREISLPILLIEINDGIHYRKWLIPFVVIISNYLRYPTLIWFLGSALASGILLYRRQK